jgi:hemerythrin-like domain-containing protein
MRMQETVAARRRAFLAAAAGLTGAGLALAACAPAAPRSEVPASEAVLADHGLVARIACDYREAAALIRANFSSVDGRQVWRLADFWRGFGEAYHQPLEEAHIFPQAMKAGGEAAGLVPILIAQHARGRQITAYVQAKTAAGAIAAGDADALVLALESFARMAQAHEAYEDTVLLPAWRKSLSAGELRDAAGQFAQIEAAAFKPDGLATALADLTAVEDALRIRDLARYTADAPGAPAQGVIPMPPGLPEGGD